MRMKDGGYSVGCDTQRRPTDQHARDDSTPQSSWLEVYLCDRCAIRPRGAGGGRPTQNTNAGLFRMHAAVPAIVRSPTTQMAAPG